MDSDLGIWQTILFAIVHQGKDVDEAVASANLALAAYRTNFEDKCPSDES